MRILVACALSGLATGVPPVGAAPAVRVALRVDPGTVIQNIPEDFLGLGYETSAVARTGYFSPANAVLVQLYRTLGSHGLIRIGGNVSDHTRYVADGVPRAEAETQTTIITRQSLLDLGAFLRVTGWKAIWGLNLGTGSLAEAVTEAQAVTAALGDRLDCFQVGNEVDQLPRFHGDYEAYHAAFLADKAAIRAVLPAAVFSGPDVASHADWAVRFASEEAADLRYVTLHYYRAGAKSPKATLATLLQPDPGWAAKLATVRAACAASSVDFRITETNSFYGGGKAGVSDRFGSALWALDYLFGLAASECRGVNLETDVNQLGWVSHYSPIGRDAADHLTARPSYYAMLAFALAANGKLIRVARDPAPINLHAYGTVDPQGVLWVVVVNLDLTSAADIALTLPGDYVGANLLRLRAPSVDSADQVTLGGTAVTPEGTWTAGALDELSVVHGAAEVPVPAASAALLRCSPAEAR